MEIRRIPIEQINPAQYNPRKDLKPGSKEYEQIKRSIKEFGLVDPLVWNERTGNLVGGHQRLKVLREMGLTEVEVSVVNLDEEREKALNLALNRAQGDWDKDKLAALLKELAESETVDMTVSGFTEKDLARVLREIEEREGPEGSEEWAVELQEYHDYIVLYFDNDLDFLKAKQVLGIKDHVNIKWGKWDSERVRRETGQQKQGLGRVIPGAQVVEFLVEHGYQPEKEQSVR